MLQQLCELADRLKAKGQPGFEDDSFELKPIDFVLTINEQGAFIDLQSTATQISAEEEPLDEEKPDDKKKGKSKKKTKPAVTVKKTFLIPTMPKRANSVAPGFLVDNAKYVLGYEKAEEGVVVNEERNKRCHQAFVDAVRKASAEVKTVGMNALTAFFDDLTPDKARKIAEQASLTGSELIVFALQSSDWCIHEEPDVRSYWRALLSNEGEKGSSGQCLVTGEFGPLARLHPLIKRIPNGQPAGTSLVSFNANAFESFGLSQGDNAPISRVAAVAYGKALNYLLEKTNERTFRYGVRVGDGVMVFWTKATHSTEVCAEDIFADILEPNPQDAIRFAESVAKGLEKTAFDQDKFYAVTLSANASRVVVRDWLEMSVGELKKNVSQYFDDLRIGSTTTPIPFGKIFQSLQSPGGGDLSPQLSGRLFTAALTDRIFPRELLAAAVRRMRIVSKAGAYDLHPRCAIIKASLLRIGRNNNPPREVTVTMDENNHDVAYLLGRLFAVLERLQGDAQGDLNASMRDKYFGAASATPAAVFPRLIRLSMHHTAKSKNGDWFEKLKTQIIAALPGAPLPTAMNLEQQGLFAIGYYHQREVFFQPSKNTLPQRSTIVGNHHVQFTQPPRPSSAVRCHRW